MVRLTLLTLATATLAWAAAPLARVEPPRLRFTSSSKPDPFDGGILLTFEASNTNATPLRFWGRRANSFSPPLPEGRVAPVCAVELRQGGGAWRDYPQGYCCYGTGKVALRANGRATFQVAVPGDGWEEVRVGLVWLCRGAEAPAWSAPLPVKATRRK